jgi:hypothetical protein
MVGAIVTQLAGLPIDVLKLIWDQVGDREIFLASLCSKEWMPATAALRSDRDKYITGASRLHPTLFPDESHTSSRKLAILQKAIDNLKIGRALVVTISSETTRSGLKRLTGLAALQDGGNIVTMEHEMKHKSPRPDRDERQRASCCSHAVDISRYPQWHPRPSYSIDTLQCHPVGKHRYIQCHRGYGAVSLMLLDASPDSAESRQLRNLASLFTEDLPHNIGPYYCFNSSAEQPLLAVRPRFEGVLHVGNLLTEEILTKEMKIQSTNKFVSFCGRWLLLSNPNTLFNVYSGERLDLTAAVGAREPDYLSSARQLVRSDDWTYMLNAHRLVAHHSSTGELKAADLRDDTPMQDIVSQLHRNSFTVVGLSGKLACVSGRIVVIMQKSGRIKLKRKNSVGSEDELPTEPEPSQLQFVDVSDSSANIIGTIRCAQPIGQVQAIDPTLFLVQRGDVSVDLLDLLAREPLEAEDAKTFYYIGSSPSSDRLGWVKSTPEHKK